MDVRFVVIGAGGLGCPALLSLCSAGARQVTIVDPDVVERSNLQRQILYDEGDVGMRKTEAAKFQLRSRFASLELHTFARRLDPEDAEAFLRELPRSSIVLECSDMPALKFAVNDAGLRLGIRVVIGAAIGMRCQALAVVAGRACYRCIYEQPPPGGLTCAAAGVLGPAVGLGGALMATLAVNLARGNPETAGRLVAFDVMSGTAQHLTPTPRPGCPACDAQQNGLPSPAWSGSTP